MKFIFGCIALNATSGVCLLLWQLLDVRDWVAGVMARASYPFGIDYGEGVVWQQALMLRDGTAFGPLQALPATPFNYPPLFHIVILVATWASGADMLMVGRLLSALATLLSAVGSAGMVWQATKGGRPGLAAWVGILVAGLMPASEMPGSHWAGLMRVDSLAVGLGMLGLFVGVWAPGSARARRLAMLCFVLAVYTKQTMVTAPVAFLLALAWVNRGAAWRALWFGVLLGLPPLIGLLLWTDGRAFTHLFTINLLNRFDLARALELLRLVRYAALSSSLVLVVCVVAVRRLTLPRAALAEPRRFAVMLMCLNVLMMTFNIAAMAKSGAALNYLMGPLYGICPVVGFAVAWAGQNALRRRHWWDPVLLPVVCVVMLAQFWRSPPYPGAPVARLASERALQGLIAGMPGDVIAEDPAVLLRAGRRYVFEPSMMTELASTGWWDETAFLMALARHRYPMLVLEGQEGDELFNSRFTPAMRKAMRRHYPCGGRIGRYLICLPARDEPAVAG